VSKLKTILITGGAGFIGSNLCEYFLNQGYQVRCVDNFITGKKENIAALFSHPNFIFFEKDIRNYDDCIEITKDVDAVLHQAALGSVPRSIENPLLTNEINCQGFLNTITAAKNNNVKRFVYASSSSVYGDSVKSPKIENELGKPLSPYAISKLTNELYGSVFHQLYGMETIGLRYFNVFGKNQDPNGAYAAAIPKFIEMLRNSQSPTIYGDGNQTRDFTYIKNVVHANECALLTNNNKSFGEAYNVACGISYSLIDVIEIIKKELLKSGKDISGIKNTYLPKRSGDILNSLASIKKIQDDLKYVAKYSFELGMEEYLMKQV